MLLFPSTTLRVFAAGLLSFLVATMFYLGSQPSAPGLIPAPPWDKLLHLAVFGAYTGMAWVAFGGRRRWWPALITMAIASTDEVLQAFVPGRSSDWTDIAADMSGALIALWILNAARDAQRRRRSQAMPPSGASADLSNAPKPSGNTQRTARRDD